MAPSIPPPPSKDSFAAFTIASTRRPQREFRVQDTISRSSFAPRLAVFASAGRSRSESASSGTANWAGPGASRWRSFDARCAVFASPGLLWSVSTPSGAANLERREGTAALGGGSTGRLASIPRVQEGQLQSPLGARNRCSMPGKHSIW